MAFRIEGDDGFTRESRHLSDLPLEAEWTSDEVEWVVDGEVVLTMRTDLAATQMPGSRGEVL